MKFDLHWNLQNCGLQDEEGSMKDWHCYLGHLAVTEVLGADALRVKVGHCQRQALRSIFDQVIVPCYYERAIPSSQKIQELVVTLFVDLILGFGEKEELLCFPARYRLLGLVDPDYPY